MSDRRIFNWFSSAPGVLAAADGRKRDVRKGPILLQKSFCSTEHKFSGLWVRLSKNYVGDYFIVR
jgi:hypothetical protein